mgnify:CR=1 FL=1|jgi:hypothetical protein|tara:strand:+ start:585 stop:752 length:168 start_codon:yes stop_codon:yes gene_type:complete
MPNGVRDMGFFIAINLFLMIGMKTEDKIFYAMKRIAELERLIKDWQNAKQVCKKN